MSRKPVCAVAFSLLAPLGMALVPATGHAVDGVVLITQARALAGNVTPGDGPGFPVTISRSGSYRLASNLTVAPADANGIEIAVDSGVTIDLNGFAIVGPGSGTGRGINSLGGDITVINGSVVEMGEDGIRLNPRALIENMSVARNGGNGIFVTSGGRINNCIVADNELNGIVIGATSIVTGTVSAVNGLAGIVESSVAAISGSIVKDSTVSRNGSVGLQLESAAGYGNNVLVDNNGGNANPQVSGGIEIATNICGGDTVCP